MEYYLWARVVREKKINNTHRKWCYKLQSSITSITRAKPHLNEYTNNVGLFWRTIIAWFLLPCATFIFAKFWLTKEAFALLRTHIYADSWLVRHIFALVIRNNVQCYVACGLWLCYHHSTFVLLFTFLFFLPEWKGQKPTKTKHRPVKTNCAILIVSRYWLLTN